MNDWLPGLILSIVYTVTKVTKNSRLFSKDFLFESLTEEIAVTMVTKNSILQDILSGRDTFNKGRQQRRFSNMNLK